MTRTNRRLLRLQLQAPTRQVNCHTVVSAYQLKLEVVVMDSASSGRFSASKKSPGGRFPKTHPIDVSRRVSFGHRLDRVKIEKNKVMGLININMHHGVLLILTYITYFGP